MVAFTENGKQVMVEYSGNVISGNSFDGFIDVRVQSIKIPTETLQFVEDEVIKPIRKLCASPTLGCQGVTLAESILRPRCVKELWECIERRDQAMNEHVLIKKLLSEKDFEGYVHHWPDNDFDSAESLLGEVVWKDEIANTRIADMIELSSDLIQENQADSEIGHEEPITSLQELYAKLKEDMSKLGDDVVDRVNKHTDEKLKPIYDMQCNMLLEISKSINRVIDHSMHSLQRQVPCYVYLSTDDLGKGEWLISSLVPGLKSVQLHLMCEHKGNIHKVVDQKGVPLRLESEALLGARPYVIWGLRIITMLMKVSAHGAAGLGSMVPDLEKSLLKGVASVIPNVSSDALGKEGTPSEQVNHMRLKDYKFKESEIKTAKQWLVNFLKRDENKDIQRHFGLQRIRYTDESKELAWVCQKHINEGLRTRILELCLV